jgi:hypothetical protein
MLLILGNVAKMLAVKRLLFDARSTAAHLFSQDFSGKFKHDSSNSPRLNQHFFSNNL